MAGFCSWWSKNIIDMNMQSMDRAGSGKLILISTEAIEDGMRLARDILSPEGLLLLPRGSVIKSWISNHLKSRGVKWLWVYEEEFREDASTPVQLAEKRFFTEYLRAVGVIKEILQRLSRNQTFEETEIKKAIAELMPVVLSSPRIMHFLAKARQSGETLYTHLINVGVLTMLLGHWLNLGDEEIVQLGVAGVMHDIGKSQVEKVLLDKPGPLTPQEWDQMKAHTVLGYVMAVRSGISVPVVLATILQHHEREDGSGYPNGLDGSQINPAAKAVMVADVFEAVTARRPYRHRFTIYHASEVLQGMLYGRLCPRMTTTFLQGLSNFYIGNRVRLSSGEVGEVVWIDRFIPTRPTVRVGDKYYDLMRQREIHIVEEILEPESEF